MGTYLVVTSTTTTTGLVSEAGIHTLFYGLTAYSIAIGVLSSISFGCLIRTLFAIKKNLGAMNETAASWPPLREVEEKLRPFFSTEKRSSEPAKASNGIVKLMVDILSRIAYNCYFLVLPTTIHEDTGRHASSQDYRTAYLSGPETARTATQVMADVQVLDGYKYAPGDGGAEKGLAALAAPGTSIEISMLPA
ncbi:hypothetical protein CVT25_003385 [Psilocybe cyanescens]|uniref:Uncharacterized protein n=1 Tax=Psilocybe cyanescens TaxID=93625 RepID=A0A409WLR5_PSICY|nr:hypothetical protein CVT25_003385 [Psilocybe cyanescens]